MPNKLSPEPAVGALTNETRARFSAFAAAMRGNAAASNGTELQHESAAKIALYQKLFFNNVHSLLRNAFPVASKMLDHSATLHSGALTFEALAARFYREHVAMTPRFTEFAPQLMEYLQRQLSADVQSDLSNHWLHPWPASALLELLHYEWLETELQLSTATLSTGKDLEFDLHSPARYELSPLARPVAYHFPVPMLGAHQLPSFEVDAKTEPCYLLLWRDHTHQVHFQQLELGALQLALNLQQQPLRADQIPAGANELVRKWLTQRIVQRAS